MTVYFRNVDALPTDDVATWPYEAIVEVIDRGLVTDWQPLFSEIRLSPWGPVARKVERHLSYREADAVGTLFGLALDHARDQVTQNERTEVASRVAAAVERSGLTQAAFAELVGTSASRLSTYLTGKVIPSATMLLRIEAATAGTDPRSS